MTNDHEENDKAAEILARLKQIIKTAEQLRNEAEQLMERNDRWVEHLVQAHRSNQISHAHFAEMMDAAIEEGSQAEHDLAKACEALGKLLRATGDTLHDN
jgi:hypothetical protein